MTQTKTAFALVLGTVIAAAGLAASAILAMAQDQATSQDQLDRIEQKLDRIIQQLGITDEGAPAGTATSIQPSDSIAKTEIPPPPDVQSYQPGAVAIARAAPEKADALADISADSIGSFVYPGGAIPLSEISRNGVRYTGLAGVELQGWLKVTDPGRTQIGVEYRLTTGSNVFINPACIASIWLEDQPIGSRQGEIPMPAREEKTVSFVFGADLKPGLYKLRAWLGCTAPRDLRALNAELLIKTSADMNLRAVTSGELLHQE